MRDESETGHILDVHDHHHQSLVGRPAGIFWLDGRCVMAAHETAAENMLLERGAILVGTLRFDPDGLEGTHPGAVVERVPAVLVAASRTIIAGSAGLGASASPDASNPRRN